VKLTDGEKLIAIMLADIMEKIGADGEIDPSFVKTAIFGDDGWALKWKYSGLFHNDGPDDAVVSETGKIMTMCRVLENSIAQLSAEEREAIPAHQQTVFVGFDGNEEPHYGVATMLVQHLDRFGEWADRDLNSHHATIEHYRAMFRAYDGMKLPMSGKFPLADIQTILAAPAAEARARR
jgi:uncharacterized protein